MDTTLGRDIVVKFMVSVGIMFYVDVVRKIRFSSLVLRNLDQVATLADYGDVHPNDCWNSMGPLIFTAGLPAELYNTYLSNSCCCCRYLPRIFPFDGRFGNNNVGMENEVSRYGCQACGPSGLSLIHI